MPANDLLLIVAVLIAVVLLVLVMHTRRRQYREDALNLARENACAHLQPVLDHLLARGHRVRRIGQKAPDMPLEIHITPPFDPQALMDELQLEAPVHLSDRGVIYCREDWCELCPVKDD